MESLKVLFSNASNDKKIESAKQVFEIAKSGREDGKEAATTSAATDCLPELVRAHYLRQVTEWMTGFLPKLLASPSAQPSSTPGEKTKGSKNKKDQQHQTPAINLPLAHAAWKILAEALSHPLLPSSCIPPSSLLESLTSVLHHSQEEGLLESLSQVMGVLRGRMRVAFRPSLEHTVSLAEAVLLLPSAPPALPRGALELLLDSLRVQGSAKRAFQALVPRLLPGLCLAAFPSTDTATTTTTSPAPANEIASLARTILRESLLHPDHRDALIDLAQRRTREPRPGDKEREAAESYQADLFEWIRGAAASEDPSLCRPALALLPWLLESLCGRDDRRAGQEGASTSKPAGSKVGDIRSALTGSSAELPRDFAVFRALADALVASIGSTPAASPLWAVRVRGLASLLRSCRAAACYRPTIDLGGLQLASLRRIGEAVLRSPQGQPSDFGGHEEGAPSAALFLEALLALDHRPVEPYMATVWALCWTSGRQASTGAVGSSILRLLAGTYAELRQLPTYLQSLVSALLQCDLKLARGAVQLLEDGAVQGTLRGHVAGIPGGQAAVLVATLRTCFDLTKLGAPTDGIRDVIGATITTALDGVAVSVSSAANVGTETKALIDLTEADLLSSLEGKRPSSAALSSSLSIYCAAMRLYMECCGLQPSLPHLEPFKGALTDPTVPPGSRGQAPSLSPRFLPSGGDKLGPLPRLLKALAKVDQPSPSLFTATAHAASLRLAILTEVEARTRYTTKAAAPDALDSLLAERSKILKRLAELAPSSDAILTTLLPYAMDEATPSDLLAPYLTRQVAAALRTFDPLQAPASGGQRRLPEGLTAAVDLAVDRPELSEAILTGVQVALRPQGSTALEEDDSDRTSRSLSALFAASSAPAAAPEASSKKRKRAEAAAPTLALPTPGFLLALDLLLQRPGLLATVGPAALSPSKPLAGAVRALLSDLLALEPSAPSSATLPRLVAHLLPSTGREVDAEALTSIGAYAARSNSLGALLTALGRAEPSVLLSHVSHWAEGFTAALKKLKKGEGASSAASSLETLALLQPVAGEARGRSALSLWLEATKDEAPSLLKGVRKALEDADAAPLGSTAVVVAAVGAHVLRSASDVLDEKERGRATSTLLSALRTFVKDLAPSTASSPEALGLSLALRDLAFDVAQTLPAAPPAAVTASKKRKSEEDGDDRTKKPAESVSSVSQASEVLHLAVQALRALGEPPSPPSPVRFTFMGAAQTAALAVLTATCGPEEGAATLRWELPVRSALLEGIQAVACSAGKSEAVLIGFLDASCEALRSPQGADLASLQALMVAVESSTQPAHQRAVHRRSARLVSSLLASLHHLCCAPTPAHPSLLCAHLRALESLVAREGHCKLKASMAADVTGACHVMLRSLLGNGPEGVPLLYDGIVARRSSAHSVHEGSGVFAATCGVLSALIRHRLREVKRCAALLVQSCTLALALVLRWEIAAAPLDLNLRCAEELARVLEAFGSQKEHLAKYCPHIVSAHITFAEVGATLEGTTEVVTLRPAVLRALRQGVFYVFAACGVAELQQVHVSVGSGFGGLRRNALATLKAEFEREFRYTGKV